MTLDINNAPSLAAALIELRGETFRAVSAATNIKPANLSVWIRGREQVISQKRVARLLQYLDVVGANLCRDKIHCWTAHGDFDPLNVVLNSLLTDERKLKSVLCSDGKTSFPYKRFLGIWSDEGWVWIGLNVMAGLANAPVLDKNSIGFGYEFVLPLDFGSLPPDSPDETEQTLLAAIEALVRESGVANLNLGQANNHLKSHNTTHAMLDMAVLHNTLQHIIDIGVTPEKIVQLLSDKFLGSQ